MFLVGIDPFIGNDGNFLLSQSLLDYSAEFGFSTLAHIIRPYWMGPNGCYWLQNEDLGLQGNWIVEWNE